ncbi:MAG: NUDIX hydrolase [Alphaproteobacteria bacterium]|nr:NUDIX hydrolase [Alphaproteobacteria bacterium]
MSETPAPRPAATVLPLRDGPGGLEVFMLVRAREIDFASGAWVFPGGRVDGADTAEAARTRATGAEGLSPEELGYAVAAAREAFEECGILLARPAGESRLVEGGRAAALFAKWRGPLVERKAGIGEVLAAENLVLALDRLVTFAHWLTPPIRAKRFDTRFFLMRAPEDHVARHDGHESIDSAWVDAAKAVSEGDAGARKLVFATRQNLDRLSRSASVESAFAAARAQKLVPICPEVVQGKDGPALRIPADAGYAVTEMPLSRLPRP